MCFLCLPPPTPWNDLSESIELLPTQLMQTYPRWITSAEVQIPFNYIRWFDRHTQPSFLVILSIPNASGQMLALVTNGAVVIMSNLTSVTRSNAFISLWCWHSCWHSCLPFVELKDSTGKQLIPQVADHILRRCPSQIIGEWPKETSR